MQDFRDQQSVCKEKCKPINGQTTYVWGLAKTSFLWFHISLIVLSHMLELFNLKQWLKAMILGPKTSVSVFTVQPLFTFSPSAADIKVGKRSGWPAPRLVLIIAVRKLRKNTPNIQTEHPAFCSFTKEL